MPMVFRSKKFRAKFKISRQKIGNLLPFFSGFDLSTSQSWVFVLSFNKASGKFYYCSGLKKIRERG